ncbi:MAG: organic solvent tolerance protein OstA [Planctomycetaceae bacterium]
MVLWRRTDASVFDNRDRVLIYLEGNARMERPGSTIRDNYLIWEFVTTDGVTDAVRHRLKGRNGNGDPLFERADARRKKSLETGRGLQPTQLIVREPNDDLGPRLIRLQMQRKRRGIRRVRIFPRSAVSFSVQSFESKETTPPEQVWVLTGGINMVIDGGKKFGLIDLSADAPVGLPASLPADRMVVWTQTAENANFQNETVQSQDTPFEVYLEGNIVVRQGTNVVRAARAAYDARENKALVLDAELRSYVPALKDTVRIRAQRIRQLSRNSFHATNAWTTTSKFGVPGYRIQASDIFLDNRQTRLFGPPEFDPETGEPTEVPWLTSLNNTFYLDQTPVFYLPYISAPAEDPNIPVRRFTVGQDRIFGTRVQTEWDVFGLLGMAKPRGVRWNVLADYFSDRGPAVGMSGGYQGRDPFGVPGRFVGEGLIYGVLDSGRDNLGFDRRNLLPEREERGRIQWRHRHDGPAGITVLGELGLLSDRNFLEQYYEREFDRDKDIETLLYAKQQQGNTAWSLLVRPQVNDFENTTAWLPRGDLYVLTQPFFDGRVTWSSHSSAGYGRLQPADAPTDPADLFTPLPFVADVGGAVLMTRHEINAPFSLGPVRVVPYGLGEAAFWSEGFNGDEVDRFVGSAGVRGSLMFWKVLPQVYSQLLNLNGLAHKSLIEFDYSFTDSTRDLRLIPQYNEFDENSQERFRQRFLTNTFGGVLPPQFEPRNYAVRSGAGRSVSVPYHELIDDQQVLRLAWRNTLQTKVGPPERLRIKDWMTLDLEASLFPSPNRDNFGEDFGLLGAFYRWQLSDQTSLLAGAQYDLFDRAQQIWNVGFITARTTRGSLYLGVRQIKGANLSSQILTASYSYKMSPKWITTLSTAYDMGESRNVGQAFTLTRVGADFLVHLGANFDASKNNAGIVVSVEPRIGAIVDRLTKLGSLLQPTP